jgi:hypothetical protein
MSLAVSQTNIFAGTKGCGIWLRPLSQMITSVGEFSGSKLPAEYSLEQNYPNPFNPSTAICYSLSSMSRVKLTVYNLLGQVASVLIDDLKPAGNYKTIFNAAGLPSGIYFYSISIWSAGGKDQYNAVRKMSLIK